MTRSSVALLAVLGGIATVIVSGCEDDPHRRTAPGQVLGAGGACEARSGALPEPKCDDSQRSCAPTPGCVIDRARCGSATSCLPMADNAGRTTLDFRIRRLNIATPTALASPFIQNTVVSSGIELSEESCAERGTGLFSWLLRIDERAGTLTTGGAPPARDPFSEGYCFARFALGGRTIAPITTRLEATDRSTFRTTERKALDVPIFLSAQLSSAIILPLREVRVEGVEITSDGKGKNCIGAFNAAALDPSCTEDRDLCAKWSTAGSLGGYITLEDADQVKIRDLDGKSLCAFLAGDAGRVCARDANGRVSFGGDYCSTTAAPDGCRDSVWLAATFAASAATIFDGEGLVEGCSGAAASPDDAGRR